MQLGGDDAADASVAADDEMIFDLFEHTYGAAPFETLMQPAFDNEGGQQRHGVKRRSDAAENQHHCEEPAACDSGCISP
jgi:hypothetical protein